MRAIEMSRVNQVMVVDSSPELRCLLRVLLEEAGMVVEESYRGEAALDRLSEWPLHRAVVLDHRLPDISGLEVAARLIERGEDVSHLVLFSSHLLPLEQAEAERLGIRIVQKANVQELVSLLREGAAACC